MADIGLETMFIAPASIFLDNIQKEYTEAFKECVFSYEGMVFGICDKVRYIHDTILVSLKANSKYYIPICVAISKNADLSKFHVIQELTNASELDFIKMEEGKIKEIIKENKV